MNGCEIGISAREELKKSVVKRNKGGVVRRCVLDGGGMEMAREEGEGVKRLKETSGLAHVVVPADCRRRLQGHTQRAVRRRPGR